MINFAILISAANIIFTSFLSVKFELFKNYKNVVFDMFQSDFKASSRYLIQDKIVLVDYKEFIDKFSKDVSNLKLNFSYKNEKVDAYEYITEPLYISYIKMRVNISQEWNNISFLLKGEVSEKYE